MSGSSSKSAILDKFSEQHQHQTIKKASYLMQHFLDGTERYDF